MIEGIDLYRTIRHFNMTIRGSVISFVHVICKSTVSIWSVGQMLFPQAHLCMHARAWVIVHVNYFTSVANSDVIVRWYKIWCDCYLCTSTTDQGKVTNPQQRRGEKSHRMCYHCVSSLVVILILIVCTRAAQ